MLYILLEEYPFARPMAIYASISVLKLDIYVFILSAIVLPSILTPIKAKKISDLNLLSVFSKACVIAFFALLEIDRYITPESSSKILSTFFSIDLFFEKVKSFLYPLIHASIIDIRYFLILASVSDSDLAISSNTTALYLS